MKKLIDNHQTVYYIQYTCSFYVCYVFDLLILTVHVPCHVCLTARFVESFPAWATPPAPPSCCRHCFRHLFAESETVSASGEMGTSSKKFVGVPSETLASAYRASCRCIFLRLYLIERRGAVR